MGVIKRAENLFEIRTSLSEETLFLPSSDEEEYDLPLYENERQRSQPPRVLKPRPPPVGPAFSNLKSHSGKKKCRRYHNERKRASKLKLVVSESNRYFKIKANQLITLAQEDELNEVTIDDFISSTKSPFSVLLEDDQSLQRWDEFVSSNEEKQRELLELTQKRKPDCGKQPLINRTLKSLLRKKSLPIGMLQYLEQELVSFFSAQPTETYISPALSSFERLLLHSLSNYHRLASLSFVAEPENVKLVRIKNPRAEFPSPPLLLVQYLESNYGTH